MKHHFAQRIADIYSFADNLPESIFVMDRSGRIVYANNHFSAQLGYERENLQDLSIKEIDKNYESSALDHYWKPGNKKPEKRISTYRCRQGKEIRVSVMSTLEILEGNEFCIVFAADILGDQIQDAVASSTDGAKVQAVDQLAEELEQHKALLHSVVDELPNPLVVKDYECKILLTNNAVAKLYGVDNPDDMIGKDDGDYIPDPEQAEFFRKNVRDIMDGGVTQTVYEDSYDAVAGKKRHYMSIKKPFLNQKGEKNILVIANDITEIRESEEAKLQYEKIMSISSDFLSFQDKNGVYRAVNQAYLKAFNVTRDQIIGKSNREILGEEHYEKYIRPKFESALKGEIDSYETWVDFPNYGKRFVKVNYYPYRPQNSEKVVGMVTQVNDITERKKMENALEAQKNLLREVIDEVPNPLVVKDYDGKFVLTNRAVATLYGVDEPDDMIGKDDGDYIPDPEQAEFFKKNVREIMDGGKTQIVYEESYDAATGEKRHYMSVKKPFLNQKGEKNILVIANDITDIRKAEKTLLQYEKIMSLSHDLLAYLDKNGIYQAVNEAYLHAFKTTREKIIGAGLVNLFGEKVYQEELESHFQKALTGEMIAFSFWFSFPELGKRFVEVSMHPYSEEDLPTIEGLVLKIDDITDHFEIQERLRHMADHDTLTGLANRRLFSSRLSQAINRAQRHNRKIAVLFIDLDRFKIINDSLGHATGDKVLIEITNRLSRRTRHTDTLARSGGDEFLLLLEDFHHNKDLMGICESLLDILAQPIIIGEHELFVSASIGVSTYPKDETDEEKLIQSADAAMYQAKKSGRNAYQFSSPDMRKRILERVFLEKNLRQALAHDEFCLFYQPQINMQTREIKGAEALLRWIHPSEGMIFPGKFIPIAEEIGLILPIGKWVLEEACRQMKEWLDKGYKPNSVSVNIAGNQILQSNFTDIVRECLAKTGLDPQYLELEITESYLMQDIESVAYQLSSIRELGVRVAIDDFGTSHSSLRYLQQLPLSKLKIDRSFVQDIPENQGDRAIVKTIIDLAHNMDLTVIAEGVETEAQASFLLDTGCRLAQGFLYAKPMDADAFRQYIE